MQGSALAETMAQQAAVACAKNLANAEAERNRIAADVARLSDKRRNDTISALRGSLDRLAIHERTLAQIAAERETLSMRHGVAEDVLSRAKVELDRIAASDEFGPILETLLSQILDACKADGNELRDATILVPPKYVDRIRGWIGSHDYPNLPVEADAELADGAAVEDANKSFRISHTLSGRYERLENKARAMCLNKLFGGEI